MDVLIFGLLLVLGDDLLLFGICTVKREMMEWRNKRKVNWLIWAASVDDQNPSHSIATSERADTVARQQSGYDDQEYYDDDEVVAQEGEEISQQQSIQRLEYYNIGQVNLYTTGH